LGFVCRHLSAASVLSESFLRPPAVHSTARNVGKQVGQLIAQKRKTARPRWGNGEKSSQLIVP